MFRRLGGVLAQILFLLVVALPAAYAQDVAALTGVVTDRSGSVVSNAVVRITDTRTGANFETKTASDGSYRFLKLQPGPGYTLTATKDGFETVTISNLYLAVATTRTQDIQLEIGSVNQVVEVKSEGSVSLNTTDTTIGNNFDMHAIASLPNQFRDNPASLLRLEPGVVSADPNDDASASRDGSVAGARADQNNITVDGIDSEDFALNQAFAQISPLPVDAIQEFRTEVGNPLAQNGRGSGAQTIITSRGGTNDWHGDAREYHRNTITEANSFFNNKAGVPRTNLIRNQFGGNVGGPVKKDKLFFFFDYDGRRDASQLSELAIVPLDTVRNGNLAYINNNPGCGPTSTLQSNPNCVTVLTGAQVAALDPCSKPNTAPGPCTVDGTPTGAPVTPGINPSLLSFINKRYPHANDLSQGDGINTGGLRFNGPSPFSENTYTARVDYNITNNQKLFARVNYNNVDTVANGPSIALPGDPITDPLILRDRSWAIGHTWIISPNTINQFVYGEARNNINFANPFNPPGAVLFFNWFVQTPFTPPFLRQGPQHRVIPVPTFRDDVTLSRGKHSIQLGGLFKPIKTRSSLTNDLFFLNLGIGTATPALDPSLRPSNILQDPKAIATSNWDGYLAGFLGLYNLDFEVFNYLKNGNVEAPFSGTRRDYRYYFYEAYIEDSWKLRSDLTFTYGVRYQYDSVPYEVNGLESVAANTSLNDILGTRIENGLNGVSGFTSAPLLTYALGGKANPGGQSLYQGQKLNFSPRLGLAWNPNLQNGLLKTVFGERKTVLRAGFGLLFDQTAVSAVNFQQDQGSFLFTNQNGFLFGGATPAASVAGDPRFTAFNAPPLPVPAPPFQNPLTPFTAGSGANLVAFGNALNSFNYNIDPKLKTPYSLTYTAGLQRELPGNLQLELNYYGRFGRRLFSLADASQIVNFVDPASKTSLLSAVTALEQAARAGTPFTSVNPLAFFENQGNAALAGLGTNCAAFAAQNSLPTGPAFNSCTQLIYAGNGTLLSQGNLGALLAGLTQSPVPLLPPGVGLPSQFTGNTYASNKGWSSYNTMLVTLRKRLSRDLQFDFNYTFSHSIDNSSVVTNNNGNGFAGASVVLCDAINLNACRGNSEFDITHSISTNAVYDLPFGRGHFIGRDSSRALDEAIGGWQVSGIVTWRTGLAFPVQSGVSTTSLSADALAIFNGNRSALSTNIHTDTANNNFIQYFANPALAQTAFSPVTGQQIGNRDILRGPGFTNWDLALIKSFPLFRERYKLQFRAEAYNAFNHPNFSLPNSNVNSTNFGVISTTSGAPRVLQFALRFDF
jgi:hypothetical protein